MSIYFSISRYRSSLIALRGTDHLLKRFVISCSYSSIAAEKYLTHLLRDEVQIEKALETVNAKLDSRCITEVLGRCSNGKAHMALRFFIWAANHPCYRHTSYMYTEACRLLNIKENPGIIIDVIDNYRSEGFSGSVRMFKVVLNLCRAAKDADLGLAILRKMKEFNCRPDTATYNVVIRLLVGEVRLDEAMVLRKEMGLIDLYPDMVTYMSIIKGFCDAGRLDDAIGLVKVMEGHGCVPNTVVYSTILDGICGHGDLEMALEFLGAMEKENGKCKPNAVTYTTMVKGFVEKGKALDALRILDRMDSSGVKPNRVTFVALFDGLCKEHLDEARKVIDRYGGGEFQYDELYSLLVMSLLRTGKYKESESMFRMMMARDMKPNGLASSNMIKRIVSEGRILDAFFLFVTLDKSRNLQTIESDVYSILLGGLCQENHFVEAAKVVDIMIEGRIHLKAPYLENIMKNLHNSEEHDLVTKISSIGR